MSLQDPPYKIVLERSATFQHYYLTHVYPPAPLTVTVELLRQQKAEQEEMKRLVGELWHDEGYVFCNAVGEHLSPSTVYHNFKRIASDIGIPDARLHDLCHSYAVVSLQAGDNIKTVQANLGHHTVAFTLDVYGHVTAQMQQASAERMDSFIRTVSEAKRENKRENEG